MRKLFLSLLATILISTSSIAQNRTLPSVDVKTLDGESINITAIENNGKPIVISFWATWCKPCKKELNTIAEVYEDWQDETGVKVIAVSIDDARSATRVKPYVDAQGWEFEVLMDTNGDFKRSLNVNNVPQTFLVDGNGDIVWTHSGYSPGDEYELLEEIEKL